MPKQQTIRPKYGKLYLSISYLLIGLSPSRALFIICSQTFERKQRPKQNMSTEKEIILQFAPWESFVSPTFWHKLAELKLDHDRLSDSKRSLTGHYTNCNASGCLLEVDYTAYNR